ELAQHGLGGRLVHLATHVVERGDVLGRPHSLGLPPVLVREPLERPRGAGRRRGRLGRGARGRRRLGRRLRRRRVRGALVVRGGLGRRRVVGRRRRRRGGVARGERRRAARLTVIATRDARGRDRRDERKTRDGPREREVPADRQRGARRGRYRAREADRVLDEAVGQVRGDERGGHDEQATRRTEVAPLVGRRDPIGRAHV